MASESSILLLINLALGESSYGSYADWGAVADANLSFLEATVGEVTSKTLTSSNVTLSDTEERSLLIKLSGTLSANVEVRTNDRKGFWFVTNTTTGDFTVTFKPTSGTGIVVPQGGTAILACDGTNTLRIGSTGANGAGVKIKHATKAAGSYTAAVSDDGALHEVTATATISLKPAALLGDQWSLLVKANGAVATIDPDGAELINGASTLAIASGTSALIVCTGTAFRAVIIGEVGATSPAFLTSFSVSGSATGTMGTLTSTAASSSTSGPDMLFDRTGAASANHLGGRLVFRHQDASGNALEEFADIGSGVITATHGAEDAVILFGTMRAGSKAARWGMGGGFYKWGSTDPGAGLVAADGFQFPATVALSSNANTLDDYEEGTFTPAFTSSGATFSYSTRNGEYRKVGKLVFYSVELALNTSGNTVTGNPVTITGLPFTCNTAALDYQAANVLWNASTASYIGILALVGNSSTAITITGNTAAAQGNALPLNSNALLHATLGSAVRVSGFYSTDS